MVQTCWSAASKTLRAAARSTGARETLAALGQSPDRMVHAAGSLGAVAGGLRNHPYLSAGMGLAGMGMLGGGEGEGGESELVQQIMSLPPEQRQQVLMQLMGGMGG